MRLSRFETEILRFNADRSAYERAEKEIIALGYHFDSDPVYPWVPSRRAAFDEEVEVVVSAIRGGTRGALRVALKRWAYVRHLVVTVQRAAAFANTLGRCVAGSVYLNEQLDAISGFRAEEYMGRGQWRDYPGAM